MTKEQELAKQRAEVMLAFSEGKVIEQTLRATKSDWYVIPDPTWDWYSYDYRISTTQPEKPEWQDVPTNSGLEGYELRIKPDDKWAAEKKAYAEGKKIQSSINGVDWFPIEPRFDSTCMYRIAPELKLVPFSYEDAEQLIGKTVKYKTAEIYRVIDHVGENICLAWTPYNYKSLLDDWVFYPSLDPCGRYVEEE